VVAIDNSIFTNLMLDWDEEQRTITVKRNGRTGRNSRAKVSSKRE